MPDLCLTLLTKIEVPVGSAPLERIWSLDLWLSALRRVKAVKIHEETADYQRFDLVFDAGCAELDHVSVERHRHPGLVDVVHLRPPPGINALSATWWTEPGQGAVLFAKRRILIDESNYTPALARKMFRLLRENLETLVGETSCVPV
jgi:hypothetical protein